ncbi:helix-turn-helix transcriptional regulator [Limosilactobacillus difficilis]|uniref:helix-turn-helix transcriptional regulator n=1 Tax=Limosilactobacillus difficilis TaxID=2991838 RepID=UPI0024BB7340|nr:LuxR family transcriptional regulator [Limosilactobacillus difficilis]
MIDYERIDRFVLNCGAIADPEQLARFVLNNLIRLLNFDTGMVIFLHPDGKIKWIDEWGEGARVGNKLSDHYVWTGLGDVKSIQEAGNIVYQKLSGRQRMMIGPEDLRKMHLDGLAKATELRGIKWSMGFGLWDDSGTLMTIYAISRIHGQKYTDDEMETADIVFKHINNLFRNFYINVTGNLSATDSSQPVKNVLTPREWEVAALLLRGLTNEGIARELDISKYTVNKHIENMHAKLKVNNHSALISRLYKLSQACKQQS